MFKKYEKVGTGGGAFGIFRGLQAEMKRKTEPEEAETSLKIMLDFGISFRRWHLILCKPRHFICKWLMHR